MTELPISEEALNVAEATNFAAKGEPRSVVVEKTVRAFLQAEGFEVEDTRADRRSATQLAPQYRVVSPWRPVPTKEEGEGA